MRLLSLLPVLLLVFSTLLNVHCVNIQADCVTPDDSLGKCVEVRYCVPIMTALINKDHITNPEVAKFLRESQCGVQRNSQRVCCEVSQIDFGGDQGAQPVETTTVKLPPPPPPVLQSPSNMETCGKIKDNETPLKWVGELIFRIESFSQIAHQTKCIGTLVSYKHLIVPAHCVVALPENITLEYVEILGNEFSVPRIFIHGSYNQPKYANDIAIIELDREDREGINDAICMPDSQHEVKSSIAVVKRAGSVLKFGKSESISTDDCSSFLSQQFTELTTGQFCARVQANDTTYAPIVGAIVIDTDKRRQFTLKGFTSTFIRTEQAQDEGRPYVFTDLAHHLNWIRSVVGSEAITKPGISSTDGALRDLKPCQISSGEGYCVDIEQCSLYRDAPKPFSRQQEIFLDQIKCFTAFGTNQNNLREDGICCPEKYIELNSEENVTLDFDLDVRFQGKQGVELLDMKKCGQVDATHRIVGGTEAGLKEFPWVGLVKYKVGRLFKFTCGGSLISNKYVLTCAHCITNLPSRYEVIAVRLGEFDRRTDPDCKTIDENQQECNPPAQDVKIKELIPHPDYNTPRYANDIGLIKLLKVPNLSQGIIPICLPISNEMQQTISDRYTVAGFGFTEKGRDSDVMLKVVLPKVSKESCQSLHSSMIKLSEGHQCYGGEGIRDTCKGDSGNPLMNYVNLNGRIKAVQMGIVAAGHTDCGRGASGFPGIYTDVGYYLEWILDQMQE